MSTRIRGKNHDRGTSLLDVTLSTVIFSITLFFVGGILVQTSFFVDCNQNMSQAAADLSVISEALRETSLGGLDAVTSRDWTDWARTNELTSLPGETITVSVADPTADPLRLTVQVRWTEGRWTRSARIQTMVTRRRN